MDDNNFGGWAIDEVVFSWIRDNIEEGSVILELGSGTGTSELVKHYTVYSIEHDPHWANKYHKNYIVAPIKNYGSYKWYDRDIIENELPSDYDMILIDGPPGGIGRWGFVEHVDLFDLSVPIIVDDTNRKPEKDIYNALNEMLDKDSILLNAPDSHKNSMVLI